MATEKKRYHFCEPAPPGYIWQCGACGRRARTQAGFDHDNKRTALDHGYDESCFLNARLVPEGK